MSMDRPYWDLELGTMTMLQLYANHHARLKPLLEWAYNYSLAPS